MRLEDVIGRGRSSLPPRSRRTLSRSGQSRSEGSERLVREGGPSKAGQSPRPGGAERSGEIHEPGPGVPQGGVPGSRRRAGSLEGADTMIPSASASSGEGDSAESGLTWTREVMFGCQEAMISRASSNLGAARGYLGTRSFSGSLADSCGLSGAARQMLEPISAPMRRESSFISADWSCESNASASGVVSQGVLGPVLHGRIVAGRR